MAFMEYEVGGNEVKIDASEAIANIPENRTLLVEKLTAEEPVSPEKAEGLNSVEEVFDFFKPNIDIEFETGDGQPVKENFRFKNVGDFSVENLTDQSKFLKELDVEGQSYEKMIKQLRSNKVLQRALETPEAKKALIEALTQLTSELEESEIK